MTENQAGPPRDSPCPLVSVIIPTYGRNEHLQKAVESVCKQTYTNIELLIVDDGSPTPVTETLTDMSFHRLESVTFIRHAENRGANVARNSGIRAASGKYLAFLDDDDWWAETKISKQIETFEAAGPEVGVVYTGKQMESHLGISEWYPSAEGDVLEDLVLGATFGQFSSVMVRADAVEDAGFPDERFPAWQDREWFFRLAQHYHFKAVPEILVYRDVEHADRISVDFEKRRDVAYPLFLEKHYPIAKKHGFMHARIFLAFLRTDLGTTAAIANQHREARKYFLLAFFANPLYRPVYKYLLASLGGKWTYEPAKFLRRKVLGALSVFKD